MNNRLDKQALKLGVIAAVVAAALPMVAQAVVTATPLIA